MNQMDRRSFLNQSLGFAAALGLSGTSLADAPAPKSRVVQISDATLRTGKEQFDGARIARLLDGSLMHLTNTKTVKAAWSALFSSRDTVGLKVNCLAGPGLSTHPIVVDQIVRGLRLAGVPDGNIYIWERSSREMARAGFALATGATGLHCAGTDGRYDNNITSFGQIGSCFTPFVSRLCTAHINVPVLKDHLVAGLGVGLKNYYGAIHNPNKYHDNQCDPYVADVNACPLIKDRLRLVVCDALNAQYDGGPTLRPERLWEANTLLVSPDPVALDTAAGQIIDTQRVSRGLKPLAETDRPPTWLATAKQYNLGENDLSRIEIIRDVPETEG